MPPVNINSISITRKTPASAKAKRVSLKSSGKIHSVGESYDGNHAEVRVTHGRKRKETKGQPYTHDRPTSNFTISKRHAKHFPVGSHVDISMSPRMPGAHDGPDDESSE